MNKTNTSNKIDTKDRVREIQKEIHRDREKGRKRKMNGIKQRKVYSRTKKGIIDSMAIKMQSQT